MSTCAGCDAELPPTKRSAGRQRKWCSERCRKDSYDLVCVDCGGRVSGTDPGKIANPDEPVCRDCAPAHYRVWTPEAILCAIQEWADDHAGIPPTANAWTRERIRSDLVPAVSYVLQAFGSWNAAIIAAGYEPHPTGPVGGYTPLTPAQRKACARRYKAGESSPQIAADLGCAPAMVIKWARAGGADIRKPWGGIAA